MPTDFADLPTEIQANIFEYVGNSYKLSNFLYSGSETTHNEAKRAMYRHITLIAAYKEDYENHRRDRPKKIIYPAPLVRQLWYGGHPTAIETHEIDADRAERTRKADRELYCRLFRSFSRFRRSVEILSKDEYRPLLVNTHTLEFLFWDEPIERMRRRHNYRSAMTKLSNAWYDVFHSTIWAQMISRLSFRLPNLKNLNLHLGPCFKPRCDKERMEYPLNPKIRLTSLELHNQPPLGMGTGPRGMRLRISNDVLRDVKGSFLILPAALKEVCGLIGLPTVDSSDDDFENPQVGITHYGYQELQVRR